MGDDNVRILNLALLLGHPIFDLNKLREFLQLHGTHSVDMKITVHFINNVIKVNFQCFYCNNTYLFKIHAGQPIPVIDFCANIFALGKVLSPSSLHWAPLNIVL